MDQDILDLKLTLGDIFHIKGFHQPKVIHKKFILYYVTIDGSYFNRGDFRSNLTIDRNTGLYIGTLHFASVIYNSLKALPQSINPTSKVASVAYSSYYNTWYGWTTPYNMRSFKIGDIIDEDDVLISEVPIGMEIETVEQARQLSFSYVKISH
jgi:hypothetical protein